MKTISTLPAWFRLAKSQLAKPAAPLRADWSDLPDPIQALKQIWRLRRKQTSWLQLSDTQD